VRALWGSPCSKNLGECRPEVLVLDVPGLSAGAARGRAGRRDGANAACCGTRAATVSRSFDEPVSGTAATATTWPLPEQPGPWGARALTSSRLDPAVGRAPERAAEVAALSGELRRLRTRYTGAGWTWSRCTN
jgi:hypothetical protein